MKRVCLLTTSFPRFLDDEAGVFLQRLVEGYSARGTSGIIIVPRDKDEAATTTCANFRIHRFQYGVFRRGALAFGAGIMPNIRRNPALILQAPMLLLQLTLQAFRRKDEYDVIHANWAIALLAAWVNFILTGKPYIVTLRGEDIPLLQKPLMRVLCRSALRKAFRIVSVNRQFIGDIEKIAAIAAEKCAVIPNGVMMPAVVPDEVEALVASRGLTGKKFLLFVGTLIPRKQVDVLIRVMTLASMKNYYLVICGRLADFAYVENLRKLASELGVANRVKFEGAIAPSRVPLYLRASEFYISASAFEGRPNAVLEALAAGKIVLTSNISAHAEIIRHGENGFLFDPQNLSELDGILASLQQSPERLLALRQAALESAKGLSWDTCAAEYINIFNILA